MKKLIAIMFCILCAGLIFARGSSDSPSKKKAAAETHKVQEQTASEEASILDKYSDAEIEVLLANISSLTFPDGTIHNLVSDNQLITVHELEHQSQYQNRDRKAIFEQLIRALFESEYDPENPYSHLGIYECQAMQVEDRAGKTLNERSKMK